MARETEMDQERLSRFSALYDQYATDVLRVCYYYLKDKSRAEDVTQEVFLKLLTSDPVLEAGKEKAWLLKVALNRCRDLWRSGWLKRMVQQSPAFELYPAPDDISRSDEQSFVLTAISRLAPSFKEVILLFYYQNYSIQEISELLGLPEGTVTSRLSRAREKLKGIMEEELE